MTYPRVRRGRPAPHRIHSDRSSRRPGQRPDPDLGDLESPGHTAVDADQIAGRDVARLSRRGITRPSHPVTSGALASPSANSAGTASETMSAEPLLYTAEQAALLLQVRPSWLRRKAAARAVPCRFVGKHLRFSRSDIETIAEGDTP